MTRYRKFWNVGTFHDSVSDPVFRDMPRIYRTLIAGVVVLTSSNELYINQGTPSLLVAKLFSLIEEAKCALLTNYNQTLFGMIESRRGGGGGRDEG